MKAVISAGIDALLTFARRHDPGRAERLLDETADAAATAEPWHGWAMELRLTQARAELAYARNDLDHALVEASTAIE